MGFTFCSFKEYLTILLTHFDSLFHVDRFLNDIVPRIIIEDTMEHTLYGLPYGFSQDRASDISHPCLYGWIAWSILVVRVELRLKCVSLQACHTVQ